MSVARPTYPNGTRFAFTVMDDTDVATVENVEPIYRLLESLGMRTTKTVWALRCDDANSDFVSSETLEDPHYRDFVVDLQRRGFEIGFHNATMESSPREHTLEALDRLRVVFGAVPRVHANHAGNRENLYWGADRLDDRLIKAIYRAILRLPPDFYQGHVVGSPFFWGDLCAQHMEYVRNLSFQDINLLRVNPSMPYSDARRPYGRNWFSASDAENADAFVKLLKESNQERLEREGGLCIVATHFGKGFCVDGEVRDDIRALLVQLSKRNGWFVPVGPMLDHLRARRTETSLPRREWRTMQWLWMRDVLARQLARLWNERVVNVLAGR